ncbi:hypothetical protein LOTGIDRAFT_237304 [Lottia gigantea]|uniref:Uncharacterized protein n=1 Tax=Lottia gigantea TaxID=225164 RepID=V4BAM2_LOTGI|nr:hypothetical protein LOTGIDRAFT_237304 [Lottia gigantea]ESP04551.1 hypothetical protein LOTGIDRAFT_237304 [Lottia gigantea]
MEGLLVLREEFRLKKFGFGGVHHECFYTFVFRTPPILFLAYRLLMMCYTLSMLIITAARSSGITAGVPWSAFLTNWTYVALTIHMLLHFIVALTTFIYRAIKGTSFISPTDKEVHEQCFQGKSRQSNYENTEESARSGDDSMVPPKFYILHAIVWLSYNYVSSNALMVTIIFWSVLAPGMEAEASSMENVQLHIINTVIVFLEQCLSPIPIRLLHIIYPILYGLIYVIFSAAYDKTIYSILDWSKPGTAMMYVSIIAFVAYPLIQFLFFGIYHLKVFIYKRYTSQ